MSAHGLNSPEEELEDLAFHPSSLPPPIAGGRLPGNYSKAGMVCNALQPWSPRASPLKSCKSCSPLLITLHLLWMQLERQAPRLHSCARGCALRGALRSLMRANSAKKKNIICASQAAPSVQRERSQHPTWALPCPGPAGVHHCIIINESNIAALPLHIHGQLLAHAQGKLYWL